MSTLNIVFYATQNQQQRADTFKNETAVNEMQSSALFLPVLRNAESFKKYQNVQWWARSAGETCDTWRGSINDMVISPQLCVDVGAATSSSFECHCAAMITVTSKALIGGSCFPSSNRKSGVSNQMNSLYWREAQTHVTPTLTLKLLLNFFFYFLLLLLRCKYLLIYR